MKASHLIMPRETITVDYDMPYAPTLYGENIPLDIVFEDDYLIVVNKPAGLIVHPGAGNATGTLVNALIYHCEHLSNENGLLRPGIVHRLDKDTSGLLISAKDNRVHGNLRTQFSKRTIEKYYYTLVWGSFDEDTGEINAPIGRSPKNRKKSPKRLRKLRRMNLSKLQNNLNCKVSKKVGQLKNIRPWQKIQNLKTLKDLQSLRLWDTWTMAKPVSLTL